MERLDLTEDEILSLEGSKIPSIIAAIDKIRRNHALSNNSWVGRILVEAELQGELSLSHCRVRDCPKCNYLAGYLLFKSGPRKGKENLDKPLSKSGVRADFGSVHIVWGKTQSPGGYNHVCSDCWTESIETAMKESAPKTNAAITGLVSNNKRKVYSVTCVNCNWKGWEHELGKLPALMSGNYEGKCPKCGAENKIFHPDKVKRNYRTWKVVEKV